MNGRHFAVFLSATLLAAATLGAQGTITESKVVEATVDQLQAWMKSGQLTSRRLTEIYLSRIDRYDRHGPRLNSLLEVNPQALQIADSLDRERRTKGPRSALHGIPVVLKDAIATADQLRTSNGSYWLMDATPSRDATVARKLKDAGALVLAKGNMDEMACCNGVFSGRGGGVRNPYDLDRFASGSSSGPATAISANIGMISIGGDTRSSIRFPASVTSIVGLKPTMGLISRAGVIPGDVHLDVVGPMARTVTDVAIATGILTGVDTRDFYTRASEGKFLRDYRPFLKTTALRGARIGIARDGFFGLDATIDSVMERAITSLRQQGAVIIDSIVITSVPYAGGRNEDGRILGTASALALEQYLKDLTPDSPVRSRAQLRAAAILNPFPSQFGAGYGRGFGLDTGTMAFADYTLDNPKVKAAFDAFIGEQRAIVMKQMDAHQLDAIMFPTTSTLTDLLIQPTTRSVPPSASRGKPEIANYAALPEVTVPAGYTGSGFPVGMSLLGSAFSEGKLLGLAYAFEQATHGRRPPDLSKAPSPVDPTIPAVPANDAFAKRQSLEGTSGSVTGNLLMASVEFGEPRTSTRVIDRTVWFTYLAGRDGQLTIDDAGSMPARNDLVVYAGGTSLDRLEAPTRGQRNQRGIAQASLQAKAGTTYLIVLGNDAYGVKGGRFVLNWKLEAAR